MSKCHSEPFDWHRPHCRSYTDRIELVRIDELVIVGDYDAAAKCGNSLRLLKAENTEVRKSAQRASNTPPMAGTASSIVTQMASMSVGTPNKCAANKIRPGLAASSYSADVALMLFFAKST